MDEAAGHPPILTGGEAPAPAAPPAETDETERILLLEFRLDAVCSALNDTRADADQLRGRLAEAAAREADQARRSSFIHQELAEARAEIASLHERLSRSDALRAELEGHLFESSSRSDVAELLRLRRELLSQRQRALVNEQTAERLRTRVDELLMSRESLLARVAEWQREVQKGDPDAVDLGEFIAELRRDILVLENRNAAGERREAALRQRLAQAGVDLEAAHEGEPALTDIEEPEPTVIAEMPDATTFEGFLSSEGGLSLATDVLSDVDQDQDAPSTVTDHERGQELEHTVVPFLDPRSAIPDPQGLSAADPAVRAASFGQLIQVFEDSPTELADRLRLGLTDADPRVRRRAVLAASTARNLALGPLLDPLRSDPDPHVRRVVREVLRHAPDTQLHSLGREKTVGTALGTR